VVSRSAPVGGRGWNLRSGRPLPATREENQGIDASFDRPFGEARSLGLPHDKATENAIRREAPNYRYVHLATPGYFARNELRSALSPNLRDYSFCLFPESVLRPFCTQFLGSVLTMR
jgi:CHAT domain-containing protein